MLDWCPGGVFAAPGRCRLSESALELHCVRQRLAHNHGQA